MSHSPLRFVVVGIGRLGGALALNLSKQGFAVRVRTHSKKSERRARSLGLRQASDADLKEASLCFFCVPDSEIHAVAQTWAAQLGRRTALVHCAGALTLEALRGLGSAPVGSFHPLLAVSDPQAALAGASVALSASSPSLLATLRKVARALALKPLTVPERYRARYHAGAVMAAGGLVSLGFAAQQALLSSGVPSAVAIEALLTLMRSALEGVAQRGLKKALTGPVARRDSERLQAHLKALPPSLRPLYRELSKQAIQLLPGPQRSLRQALKR